MPAFTRGHLHTLLAGRATPRDEEEAAIVTRYTEKVMLLWADKSPVSCLGFSIVLIRHATGCNLRPACTAALVLAVQVLRPSPT